jgi:hypothetical protein
MHADAGGEIASIFAPEARPYRQRTRCFAGSSKREPTREELEALIEQNEQSGSEADRAFAEALRKALNERA